jgi:hypothetical protein
MKKVLIVCALSFNLMAAQLPGQEICNNGRDDILSVGGSYRLGDSFISFIDLKISEKIHFGNSYDWTSSDLNGFSNGYPRIHDQFPFDPSRRP